MKIKLKENIRFYRLQLGMKQGELGKILCRSRNSISNFETGVNTPDIFTLCRLCQIFDVTLDELVEWTDEE